ncbi:MAG: hypothetical protein JW849_04140 [Phycisphaerae bacterium]|nr:hypothetical protein [Phycisphaerae bacterium]
MAIDRKRIISEMSKICAVGNEEGLIPAFNVFVTQLPASFWNGFAERLTRRVSSDMLPAAEYLLFNAARSCGYHTGFGIITSDEWKAVVGPMVEKVPDDVLHGAYAVFTAWGWAKSEVIEIVPNEKMVVRAYDYYESDVVEYGQSAKLSAYMIRGVSAAFMALAYGGDYQPKGGPEEAWECDQTKGIECGDEYGEFVVRHA